MVRKYKPKPGRRQYKKYDPEIMRKALQHHANSNDSLSTIASKYQINKSVLQRRVCRKVHYTMGGQTAFSPEREEHIIKYINTCAPWQYNLQVWDIRLLIKFYLDRRPVITKRKLENNLPGSELVSNFLKRHEDTISLRIIQNMNNNGAISVEEVLSYFHELKLSTSDVDPSNIVCYNDVLITDDIENYKNKSDEAKSNDIFVITAASVSGEMLNPYVIYKEQNCYERSRRSVTMSKQPRPRLKSSIFEDWFKSVVLPFYEGRQGKKCLIGGYYSSRISMDLLKICKDQGIDFVFLPDNSKHLTQPLDSLSQLIHTTWTNKLHQRKNNKDKLTIETFRNVIQNLVIDSTEQIIEGFKKTGINPISPVDVLKQLPDYNETIIEDVNEVFERSEAMKNEDVDAVQVKEEVDWREEYLEDSYDDDEDFAVKSNQNESKPLSKSKGIGKKTKNLLTENVDWEETGHQSNSILLDLKMSPIDFEDVIMGEDANVDSVPENIMETNKVTAGSSRECKLMGKTNKISSDPGQSTIYYVPALHTQRTHTRMHTEDKSELDLKKEVQMLIEKDNAKTEDTVAELDPLSNCQKGVNLAGAIRSGHCEDGCNTHTRLLEAILSSVTRQEKWQERAARAMEAQAQALTNITRLLGGRAERGNSNYS